MDVRIAMIADLVPLTCHSFQDFMTLRMDNIPTYDEEGRPHAMIPEMI